MTLMKHHFSHPMCNWTYTWILYVGKTSPIFNPLTHFLTCHDFKMTSSLGLRTIWLPRESMRFKGCLGIWWWICDLCYHPKFQVTHLEVLYPVPYIYIYTHVYIIYFFGGGWVGFPMHKPHRLYLWIPPFEMFGDVVELLKHGATYLCNLMCMYYNNDDGDYHVYTY